MSIQDFASILGISFIRTGSASDVIMAGDTVKRLSDKWIGTVQFIRESPYYGEDVERAYVLFDDVEYGGKSTDYLLVEEIELVKA